MSGESQTTGDPSLPSQLNKAAKHAKNKSFGPIYRRSDGRRRSKEAFPLLLLTFEDCLFMTLAAYLFTHNENLMTVVCLRICK